MKIQHEAVIAGKSLFLPEGLKWKQWEKTDNKVYNAYILMKNYVLQTDKSDRHKTAVFSLIHIQYICVFSVLMHQYNAPDMQWLYCTYS